MSSKKEVKMISFVFDVIMVLTFYCYFKATWAKPTLIPQV